MFHCGLRAAAAGCRRMCTALGENWVVRRDGGVAVWQARVDSYTPDPTGNSVNVTLVMIMAIPIAEFTKVAPPPPSPPTF